MSSHLHTHTPPLPHIRTHTKSHRKYIHTKLANNMQTSPNVTHRVCLSKPCLSHLCDATLNEEQQTDLSSSLLKHTESEGENSPAARTPVPLIMIEAPVLSW